MFQPKPNSQHPQAQRRIAAKRAGFSAAACASLWMMPAAFAESGEGITVAAAQLDTQYVTATRSDRPIDSDGMASVSVITRADIERRQPQSVAEALRGLPGLNFTNTGGPGKSTSLFVRGTNSDHVLVLVDGVEIGSATTGSAAFENLPIAQIERIEVVRGPQSGLYGSDAIGGVVQIFTRDGDGPDSSYLELGGGRFGTVEASAGVSGRVDQGWYSVNVGYFETDGIDARTLFEPDEDGFESRSISLRGGYRLGDFGELRGNFLRAQGESEFDGNPDFDSVNESEFVQQTLGLSWHRRFSGVLRWELRAAQSRDQSDNLRNGDFRSRFNTRRDEVETQLDIDVGDDRATLGVDFQSDNVESSTQYDQTSRDNTAVYGQYLATFSGLDLRLAARHDDNEQFGTQQTGNVAIGYQVSSPLRLRASFGNAFRAPSFNELFFPGFGNPDVQPERSRSGEIGADWQQGTLAVSAAVFHTEITQLIDTVRQPDDSFAPVNVSEARIIGLELSADWGVGDWDISASYTHQQPENRDDGANSGKRLRRRPDQIAQLSMDRQFGALSAGLTAYGEGRRYENAANTTRMAGYGLLDARANWQFTPAWAISARLANLLDKDYETVTTYNQPGRAFYVTLRYRI